MFLVLAHVPFSPPVTLEAFAGKPERLQLLKLECVSVFCGTVGLLLEGPGALAC